MSDSVPSWWTTDAGMSADSFGRWHDDYERGRPGWPREAVDVVGLALQGAAPGVGEGLGDRVGGGGQPRGLAAVDHQGGRLDGGQASGRQGEVADDLGVVDEGVRDRLLRGPERRRR